MQVRLNRVCFAADGGGAGGGGATEPGQNAAAQADPKVQGEKPGTVVQPTPTEIPDDPVKLKELVAKQKADFDHLLQVHGEMKAKHERRAAEDEKARTEALKKQGQFEALYQEAAPKLQAFETTVKRQEAALASFLEAELKGVPDAMRPLIPEGDAVAKLEWITKAKAAGAFGQPKKVSDGSPAPSGSSTLTMTREAFDALPPDQKVEFSRKGGKLVQS